MIPAGVVVSARVTHERADVDELAAASPDSQRAGAAGLLARPGIEEAFVLSTCNRVEAYVVGVDTAAGRAAIEGFFAGVDDDVVDVIDHDASLNHLLRVTCGLDSVVLGEDQIQGQVRDAYEDARSVGGVGPLLEMAVTKALHVGERARSETGINDGIVSLGSAAVALLDRERTLAGEHALVVGAGEMGQLAAQALADSPVERLTVANRTIPHAEHVVANLDDSVEATAIPLSAIRTVTTQADVIVTAATCTEPVVTDADVRSFEGTIVDLGQPRNVDPRVDRRDAVTVYDLDDLQTVIDRTHTARAEAATVVEAMIEREFDHLHTQYKRARADDAIATMYESAEVIKRREVSTALARLDAGESEPADVVEAMADSLVGQLLAPPTKSLRTAAERDDWQTINTALRLFDPDFGPRGPTTETVEEAPQSHDGSLGVTDD